MLSDVSARMKCPVGTLLVTSRGGRIVAIQFLPSSTDASVASGPERCCTEILERAMIQLDEYFAGRRTVFDLPLDLSGCAPFTRKVLTALQGVGYGETLTYAALAARVGSPRSARAVGRAMAANPLPVVIPCHRVVAAGGRSGGYSGGDGVSTKKWLLALEQRHRQ